ncbi:MAG: mitochondrial large ribosomal subunit protein bL28m [Actinobacteria bacterium]|nr:mitochondrial large ribosomal subunit protein bL28m [Actinomycetota bacterium]
MARCEVCGTGTQAGRYIRHKASGRWQLKAPHKPRQWQVNVRRKKVLVKGAYLRLNVCTRCIRTLDRRA